MIKGCFKNWLLPYQFKSVGRVLLLLALVVVAGKMFMPDVPSDGSVSIDMMKNHPLIDIFISIALYLAMFFMTCSREKVEDEMTAALRGETLKEICYLAMLVWVAVHIVMNCVSESANIWIEEVSHIVLLAIWVLYYGRFERKMKALHRQSREFNL